MRKPVISTRCLAAAALLLAAALTLAGCGSGNSTAAAEAPAAQNYTTDEYGRYDADTGAAHSPDAYVEMEMAATAGGMADGPTLTLPQDDRKIILTATLTLEALDYEDTCARLQQAAIDGGGYISSTSLSGGEKGSGRTASFTMRIPAENYGAFIETAGEAGNMISRTENSDDVTDQYVDVEARLNALRTQEARLLELMEESARLTDLLEVQNQLTEVQYQIESYMAQKRSLDSLTAYSTVYITVQEVREISAPVQDTYLSRIGQAFRNSWRAVGTFFQEAGIVLVSILPLLLLAGAVAIAVVVLARRSAKKRAANTRPSAQAAPSQGGATARPPYPTAPGAPVETPSADDPAPPAEATRDKPGSGDKPNG